MRKGTASVGVDVIAHSVHDQEIDGEFISLNESAQYSILPTLTRRSVDLAYEGTPEFFKDPFSNVRPILRWSRS